MSDQSARQTRAASSRRRQSWSGWAEGEIAEKDGVGVFLDDITYAFADISVLALPALWYVAGNAGFEWFGVKAAGFAAWMTMVVVAALIRGGWVAPLGTDVLGWVAMTRWLVALRLVYYNATLLVVAYGGNVVGEAVWPPVAIGVAVVGSALAVGAFPRVADVFYGVVAE